MFDNISQLFKTDKYKFILYRCLTFIVISTILITVSYFFDVALSELLFFVILFVPILFIATILPAIVLFYFLNKFLKNIYLKMFIGILLIIINCFVDILIFEKIWIYSIGYFVVGVLLPILFVTICIIPKKYLLNKKYMLIATVVLELLLGQLIYTMNIIVPYVYNNKSLSQYNPMIDSLEDYKKKYGYYPKNLKGITVIDSDEYKYTEYVILDNGNNYEYRLKKENNPISQTFIYTPNQEYKNKLLKNEQRKIEPIYYEKQGKWIIKNIVD